LAADTSKKAEVDLVDLAPRKPNWDLKRDLDVKLAKLERRTDLAIAQIIRERLREAGNEEDRERALEGVDKMEQAAEQEDD
jgi:coiled-coil domain-containing protein 12